jgi:hypothetical protein
MAITKKGGASPFGSVPRAGMKWVREFSGKIYSGHRLIISRRIEFGWLPPGRRGVPH